MPDMKRLHLAFGLIAVCIFLASARPASACPACQDAIINSSDDDPMREARAYNQSIYLMVGMPYATLGIVSLLIYRGYRKAFKKALAEQQLGAMGVRVSTLPS